MEDDFDVFVYSLSGAKINNLLSRGIPLLQDFNENDLIIVVAGSTDVYHNDPAQPTLKHISW